MEALDEYSYIWNKDKEKYVLLDDEMGKNILCIKGQEIMFCLVEDDTLADLIIEKMINEGNRVYKSISELQEAMGIKPS